METHGSLGCKVMADDRFRVSQIKALFTVSDRRYAAYTQRWADNPDARAEHERLEYELILADEVDIKLKLYIERSGRCNADYLLNEARKIRRIP